MASETRRRHPRLTIRLPVAYRPANRGNAPWRRDLTTDIAVGGVRFLTAGDTLQTDDRLELELTIPPGEGYFPYAGKIRGTATVIRLGAAGNDRGVPGLSAVAARFDDPLALDF